MSKLLGPEQWLQYRDEDIKVEYLCSKSKRIFDIIGSILGLFFGFPLIIISAVIVTFVDKVHFVFAQPRLGFQGKTFIMYKLWTLDVNKDRGSGISVKTLEKKPNIPTTKTGKFWRRTSIDELLQFWNVLRGDMSIVGYRPFPTYYMPHLHELTGNSLTANHYLDSVTSYKPGMTGLSTINGRGNLTFQQKMEYDLIYAQKASFFYDMGILMWTVVAVITQDGAF